MKYVSFLKKGESQYLEDRGSSIIASDSCLGLEIACMLRNNINVVDIYSYLKDA